MAEIKGFHKRVLHIDLAARACREHPLPEELLAAVLGGKGLGAALLTRLVRPEANPLGPENPLVFAVGPATGTGLHGSNRYGVFARSPLTNLYGESYSGGNVAPAIKGTGYDAVVISGASERPVVLDISPEGVTFADGGNLWGLDAYQAEDRLLDRAGRGAAAVVIGPAGENLVRFACIQNNRWRSAGRTGMGAVMGSKKVKGILFRGNLRAPVADEAGMRRFVADFIKNTTDNPAVASYRKYGTTQMVKILNLAGTFPTHYWSRGTLDGWEEISGDALLERYDVKARACPPCLMTCGKFTRVKEGPYAGLEMEGPEYETIYSFGGLCEIRSLDEILRLNDLCDRLGLDTITTGNLAGLLMAAAEQGRSPFPVNFGDGAAVAGLVEDIAYRRGIGDTLAEGIFPAARELSLEDLAIHVKGLEPAGYDPRVLKGMGLAYATSPRGACHLRTTFYKAELAGMIDRKTVDGKAGLLIDFEDRAALFDALILCRFYRDLYLWEELGTIVRLTTGLEYGKQDLARLANGLVSVTRAFNIRHGATRADDRLPARFFTEPINDGQDVIRPDELDRMLAEYYALRGWDREGVPASWEDLVPGLHALVG